MIKCAECGIIYNYSKYKKLKYLGTIDTDIGKIEKRICKCNHVLTWRHKITRRG